MLVTVSGMVGSGKTTVVAHLGKTLTEEGVTVVHWRFQSLPCFNWLRSRTRSTPEPQRQSTRRSGYRRKALSARVALGYAARIVAFRLFYARLRTGEWHLFNRYFYDSFVHYRLDSRRSRLYASVLQRMIPVPDIAILLVASAVTIVARRSEYAPEYLSSVAAAYQEVRARFPMLLEVSTDPDHQTCDRLDAIVRARAS